MRTRTLSAWLLASGAIVAAAQVPPAPALQDLAHAVGFGQADGGPVAAGRDYKVLLRPDGMAFVPALGDRAPHNLPLDLTFAGAWRGVVRLDQGEPAAPDVQPANRQVLWARGPGLTERLAVSPEGVELSWELASPPAGEGDLVVRLDVRTELPLLRQDADGLLFAHEQLGGVRVGRVTGRDAAGRQVQGRVEFEPADGKPQLRLSLPESFVREARYPLVLDPPITPWVPVYSGGDWPVGKPRHDAQAGVGGAYRGLCVWVSDYSAADHDILGRVVFDPSLQMPPGDLLLLDVSTLWDDLPVVSVANSQGWLLVAWVRKEGAGQRIRGLLAKVGLEDPSTIGIPMDISGIEASLARPGVNASLLESAPPGGVMGGVIYGTTSGHVRLVDVQAATVGPLGQLLVGSTSTLLSGVPNAQPTISPSRQVISHTLVAWRQTDGVHGQLLDVWGNFIGSQKLLKPASFPAVGQPRVDGAWDAFALVTTEDHPTAGLRVTMNYVDDTLAVSPAYVVTEWAVFPGEVALAQNVFDANTALRVVAFTADPAVSSAPVDTWTWSAPAQGSVLAKMPWGVINPKPVSAPSIMVDTFGVVTLGVAWADGGGNVRYQFGTPWGPGGAIVPVGAPCGEAGTLECYTEAALGNFEFKLFVVNASPVSGTAILNVGFVQPPVTCGPCSILPLQLLVAMSFGSPGTFTLAAALPGDPVLAGLLLETQAIVHTPGAGGCAGIQDWSVTNRLQFTVN
jgi:hypothetical protein